MKKPLTQSLIFHGIIVLLLFASSWSVFSRKEKLPDVKPITVQLAPMGEKTNLKPAPKREVKPPQPKKAAAPKPEPKPEPKKPEPKPEPKKPEPKKPEPKKPDLTKKTEPKPEPKPEKTEKTEAKPEKKPEKKEKPKKEDTSELDSLLKDLDAKPEPTKSSEATKNTDEKSQSDLPFDENAPISVSEVDYITKIISDQIKPCWSPPAGVRDAKNLTVTVAIDISRDGIMKFVGYENEAQYRSNPMYQAAADSARRAVLDPNCNPLRQLPPLDKYHIWKEMGLRFNPQDLF